MRDVMSQRYEKKRWYVQPTDALYDEARRLNTASPTQTVMPRLSAGFKSHAAPIDLQVTILTGSGICPFRLRANH